MNKPIGNGKFKSLIYVLTHFKLKLEVEHFLWFDINKHRFNWYFTEAVELLRDNNQATINNRAKREAFTEDERRIAGVREKSYI